MDGMQGNPIYSEMSNPEIIDTLQRNPDEPSEQDPMEPSEAPAQDEDEERKWLWAFPQIEGVPP